MCFFISPSETNILWRFPSLFAGVPLAINNFAEYLMYDWMLIEIYDPELDDYEESALVKEITRSFSRSVLFCIEIIRDILLGGVKTIVAFTSWDFVKENQWAVWPALPWTLVASATMLLGYALKGKGLALFVGFATFYIAIFGSMGASNGDPIICINCSASFICFRANFLVFLLTKILLLKQF